MLGCLVQTHTNQLLWVSYLTHSLVLWNIDPFKEPGLLLLSSMASWLICPPNGGLGKGGPRPIPGCSHKVEMSCLSLSKAEDTFTSVCARCSAAMKVDGTSLAPVRRMKSPGPSCLGEAASLWACLPAGTFQAYPSPCAAQSRPCCTTL